MMAALTDSEEQFFDTPQDIDSVSDSCSDHSDDSPNNFSYDFWTQNLESVHKRRDRFFEQMGLRFNADRIEKDEAVGEIIPCNDEIKNDIDRVNLESGAVLRNSSSNYSLFSRRSSMSCSSTEEDDLSDFAFENNLVKKVGDLNITSELNKNSIFNKLREVGSSKLVTMDNFQKSGKNNVNNWIKKLRAKSHSTESEGEANSKNGVQLRRIRVRTYKKKLKELSSFYEGQDFRAHEGLLLAMKFSPDGRFLATAGEDGVVRLWSVMEEERENKIDIESIDPSCLYFSINNCSKLVPLEIGRDKNYKGESLKKLTKMGCVIFPQKVVRIVEEPLHEFHGHSGEILALSWSSNECLLSSSVDKTVRLWQVGRDECLGVFTHNNYVTCVEFNPVDNNYFISGSIDGKIRIWEVSNCQVVDWVDIRDIVTAVCYYPSGNRGIVGSMDGSCRFYHIIDNQLQLDTQIFLPGKKKLPCKRITGFQFSPSDPTKVLVTSADSQIRVLSGTDVISKLKGPRMSGTQVTASFTEDGKHIVSGSEDSYVHVWDHNTSPSKLKSIGARESFVSKNAYIAVPWFGIKRNATSSSLSDPPPEYAKLSAVLRNVTCDSDSFDLVPSFSTNCFSLGRGISMGPVTWPEEKLVDIDTDTHVSRQMSRNEFNVLKGACECTHSSHMWNLVIMTGGRDGRIKTYHNYGLPVYI